MESILSQFPFFISAIIVICMLASVYLLRSTPHLSDENPIQTLLPFIQSGTRIFIAKQYRTLLIFFLILVVLSGVGVFFGHFSVFFPAAFIMGGLWSVLCGAFGIRLSSQAVSRILQATESKLGRSISAATQFGFAIILLIFGTGLLNLLIWRGLLTGTLLSSVFPSLSSMGLDEIGIVLLGLALGCAVQAIISVSANSIFKDATDIATATVITTKMDVPEDDIRNPASFADFVGDHVGNVGVITSFICLAINMTIALTMVLASGLSDSFIGTHPTVLTFYPILIAVLCTASSLASILVFSSKIHSTAFLPAFRSAYMWGTIVFLGGLYWVHSISSFPTEFIVMSVLSSVLSMVLGVFIVNKRLSQTSIDTTISSGPASFFGNSISHAAIMTVASGILIAVILGVTYYLGHQTHDVLTGFYYISFSSVILLFSSGLPFGIALSGGASDNALGLATMADLDDECKSILRICDHIGDAGQSAWMSIFSVILGASIMAFLGTFIVSLHHFAKKITVESSAIVSTLTDHSFHIDTVLDHFKFSVTDPRFLLGILIGGIITAVLIGATYYASNKSISNVMNEIDTQLDLNKGIWDGSELPQYHNVIETALQSAKRFSTLPIVLTVSLTILSGLIGGPVAVCGCIASAGFFNLISALLFGNTGIQIEISKKIASMSATLSQTEVTTLQIVDMFGDTFKNALSPILMVSTVIILLTAVFTLPIYLTVGLFAL